MLPSPIRIIPPGLPDSASLSAMILSMNCMLRQALASASALCEASWACEAEAAGAGGCSVWTLD